MIALCCRSNSSSAPAPAPRTAAAPPRGSVRLTVHPGQVKERAGAGPAAPGRCRAQPPPAHRREPVRRSRTRPPYREWMLRVNWSSTITSARRPERWRASGTVRSGQRPRAPARTARDRRSSANPCATSRRRQLSNQNCSTSSGLAGHESFIGPLSRLRRGPRSRVDRRQEFSNAAPSPAVLLVRHVAERGKITTAASMSRWNRSP